MHLNYLRSLYSYNAWANARILLVADQLTPVQLKRQPVAGLGSLRDILVHTLSAQWIWLSRWQGVSPSSMFDAQEFPTLETLRIRWTQVEAETQAFLHHLGESALRQDIHYFNTRGESFSYPLWQLMIHQVNHATQHRSEVAVLLTSYNYSPGDLDYLVYLKLASQGLESGGFDL